MNKNFKAKIILSHLNLIASVSLIVDLFTLVADSFLVISHSRFDSF